MKLSKAFELVYKILAAVSETLAAYMVYLFLNYSAFGSPNGLSLPNLLVVVIASVCCTYIINLFKLKNDIKYYSIAAAGLVINLAVIAVSAVCLNPISLVISTAMLVFLWLRGILFVEAEASDIYSLTQFYTGVSIFLAAYFIAGFSARLHGFLPFIGQCTIYFTVLSILLLVKCKAARYEQLENKKRSNLIDLFAAAGLVLLTLILSSQTVMKAVSRGIASAASWLFGLIYKLMIGLVYIIDRILTRIIIYLRGKASGNWTNIAVSEQDLEEYAEQFHNSWVDITLKYLAYIAVAVCIIMMFWGIRVLMRRYMKNRAAEEYLEDREFLIGTGNVKDNMLKVLRGIGKAAAGVIENFGVFNQSNGERIRHEYKMLLRLLYEKNIAGTGDTAEKIGSILRLKYPDTAQEINSITGMYERVRYGTADPDNDDVKLFKSQVGRIKVNTSR